MLAVVERHAQPAPQKAATLAELPNDLAGCWHFYVHAGVPAWSAVGSIMTGASLDQVAAAAPGDFVVSWSAAEFVGPPASQDLVMTIQAFPDLLRSFAQESNREQSTIDDLVSASDGIEASRMASNVISNLNC